jgi:hypothetical protein
VSIKFNGASHSANLDSNGNFAVSLATGALNAGTFTIGYFYG